MIDQRTVFLILLAMGLVTYVPRLLPLWLFASRSLPSIVVAWLRYVPVAVLAAMLLPSLLLPEGHVDLGWDNLYLWASIPTFIVAWRTRSLFGAVVTGMALVAGARWLFGIP